MASILDLTVTLTPPPPAAASEVLASIALRCDALGLSHSGDLLTNPLSKEEHEDLQWYLEEYWQWPYEQFLTRGQQVEALLPEIGQRLYTSLFGSREADRIVQKWLGQPESRGAFQLSLISDLPAALSLPWELLHSEQGYLALRGRRPISIMRRLPQSELTSEQTTPFEPPLRILLVTARPEGAGFVDPRGIARELLEEVQPAIDAGSIAVEFLRPPTLQTLQERLRDAKRPAIHILHFDGHGAFGAVPAEHDADPHLLRGGAQGMLAFETKEGTLDLVKAETLAQTLQDSGVQLAMLTACQSAMGSADDVFSSVAARLIKGGIKAVAAMSASVLVVSAAFYTEAFYKELAGGASAALAQERARQALYTNPRRHTVSRDLSQEGTPVELRDWWLPHFYQQAPVLLQPTSMSKKAANKKATGKNKVSQEARAVFNTEMPAPPRYGFSGRSRELLQIERWLGQGKLVVVHGFGGMGKTALAREAADWLMRTGMYQGACFVSFEGGRGTATSLLSQLGFLLGISDGTFTPEDVKAALDQLHPVLKKRPLLLIADNLESILPAGEAPLELEARTQLWDVLLELQRLGAGVLLTTRTTAFGDGRLAEGKKVVHVPLKGLLPDDAYQLAISLLTALRIERHRAPYALLRTVLEQVDYHPLAIQLVLPTLRSLSLMQIQREFAALLPHFADEVETGRNGSLLASLEYSIRRLSEEHRTLLLHLAVFEGGAMEHDLLVITQIEEASWTQVRPALEQAALLTIEALEGVKVPFLHFHPVLTPWLRRAGEASNEALQERYAARYSQVSRDYYDQDYRTPQEVRAIVQRELPNLRQALNWLLEAGQVETAVEMANSMGRFLTFFGLHRERALMQQRLAQVLQHQKSSTGDVLTRGEYLHESNVIEEEQRTGHLQAAMTRAQHLLARIEAQPEGSPRGSGSHEQALTLVRLGRCLEDGGNFAAAEQMYRRGNTLVEAFVQQDPENTDFLQLQSALLADLGNVQLSQGQYTQAKAAHEQSLQIKEQIGDQRGQAVSRTQLGSIALEQGDYAQARTRYQQALKIFHTLGESAMEAGAWHQLGRIAQEEQNWSEAERCYRESLALKEQLGDLVGAARTCNQLGQVARRTKRFEEAKGWLRRAIALSQQANPNSGGHAGYLSNLANVLVNEVQEGHVQEVSAQLAEAQRHVEQALSINQALDSPDLWMRFSILAAIADLQGRSEAAQGYRCQERDAYARFAGNRYQIDQQWGDLFPQLAAAQNDQEVRAQMQDLLSQLEENGWHITEAVQRIWAGERDWQVLVDGLDNNSALVVLRVLETLAEPVETTATTRSPEQLLDALPAPMREAIEQGDQDALQRAFAALSAQEQQAVMEILGALQEQPEGEG